MVRTLAVTMLLLAGCVPGYVDHGVDRSVAVDVPPDSELGVGERFQVVISPEDRSYGFYEITRGPSHDLAHEDVGHPLVALVEAHCDRDACAVGEPHPDPQFPQALDLEITGLQPGVTTLHVTARTSEGLELPGSAGLKFVTMPNLRVGPGATVRSEQLGGAQALLADTDAVWQVSGVGEGDSFGARTTAAISELSVSVDGDAVSAELTEAPGPGLEDGHVAVVTVHAVHPGDAVVHLTSAATSRDVKLHVVDPASLVAFEVHRAIAPMDRPDLDDPRFEPEALASVKVVGASDDLMLVERFADGSTAVGMLGALRLNPSGRFSVSPTHGQTSSVAELDPQDKLALATFYLSSTETGPRSAVLEADSGTVHLELPVSE